jgi:hypothetical protein
MVFPNLDEIQAWHQFKDTLGPTYSGSPAWTQYLTFLERKLHEYGVVNVTRNPWVYPRWSTTERPNTAKWSLISNGRPVRVAHYGAYSGATTEQGITAPLVKYPFNAQHDIDISQKIVVLSLQPLTERLFMTDYEYVANADALFRVATVVPTTQTIAYNMWANLGQLWSDQGRLYQRLAHDHAAGCLVVFSMPYDQVAGLYTFPVPSPYQAPTLYLDAEAGHAVLQDAQDGKTATIRLVANIDPKETYQLIGYLPGKNYGTTHDEQILITSHTDGPSLSQENGALGILGIVAYFAQRSQAERQRTLMLYFDNRHYMPGREEAFRDHDWLTQHSDARSPLVAKLAIEHLGQREYRLEGDHVVPTGRMEPTIIYVSPHQPLIDLAIQAIKEHILPRAIVRCPGRVGVHGKPQGHWMGLGRFYPQLPGYGVIGTLGANWTTRATINHFDSQLFLTQITTATQLVAGLMEVDLTHSR